MSEDVFNEQSKARLLKVFGLEHTVDTPIGTSSSLLSVTTESLLKMSTTSPLCDCRRRVRSGSIGWREEESLHRRGLDQQSVCTGMGQRVRPKPAYLFYQDPDCGALRPFRTRGLDANTALAFNKALRTYADLEGLTAVVSLYQVRANPPQTVSETRNESTDPLAAPFHLLVYLHRLFVSGLGWKRHLRELRQGPHPCRGSSHLLRLPH